jgi:hypothetical protein
MIALNVASGNTFPVTKEQTASKQRRAIKQYFAWTSVGVLHD